MFADAPISGDYPRAAFVWPGSTFRMTLRVESDERISGQDNVSDSYVYEFVRAASDTYEQCRSASP